MGAASSSILRSKSRPRTTGSGEKKPWGGKLLRISNEQIDSLARALADRSLIAYARKRFPGVFGHSSDEEMLTVVSAARARANALGFNEHAEVVLVFDLSVMYGPDFHRSAWARDILALPWNARRKADVMRERVRRQVPDF